MDNTPIKVHWVLALLLIGIDQKMSNLILILLGGNNECVNSSNNSHNNNYLRRNISNGSLDFAASIFSSLQELTPRRSISSTSALSALGIQVGGGGGGGGAGGGYGGGGYGGRGGGQFFHLI